MPATQNRKGRAALKTGTALALVSLSSLGMFNAFAATATIPIIARLIHAIEVTVHTAMNFGTLAVLNTNDAGTARLDPATGQLTVDSSGGLAFAGGVPRAGRLIIKGAPLPVNVTVALPTMQINNGAENLLVHNFRLISDAGGVQATVTPTGPGNSVVVNVGATISTRPNAASGTYTGANTVFANYQ